jgi:hypothetical protein
MRQLLAFCYTGTTMLLRSVVTALLIGMTSAAAAAQDGAAGTSNPNPQNSSDYWTQQRMRTARPMYQTPSQGFSPQKLRQQHSPAAPAGGAGSEGAGSSGTGR